MGQCWSQMEMKKLKQIKKKDLKKAKGILVETNLTSENMISLSKRLGEQLFNLSRI
jgi:hypothetical protein